MALFAENAEAGAAPRPPRPRRTTHGIWALAIALVALLVMTFLPTSYVIQLPGPVYNTLGSVENSDGEEVPLISIADAETFPTAGALDLLTVQVIGNRDRTPSWLELVFAWFDPSRAVVPLDRIFPPGQTTEQRNEESAVLMVDSQTEATAAALTELGYDVSPRVSVSGLLDDSPVEGVLETDDVVVAVDGEAVAETRRLQEIVAGSPDEPLEFTLERDGEQRTETVTPERTEVDGEEIGRIGVRLLAGFDFPIDVEIQLNDVGGPSAGMMFALGIIDTLTPGELNGGTQVAGTGTIDAAGVVGGIGGIRQKLYGAVSDGAEYFLAPESNCDEVVGHVPDGLQVFSVAELDDALEVLEVVRDGGDLGALPTCTAS